MRCSLKGRQVFRHIVDVHLERVGKCLVVIPAGQLDQAATAELPTVAAGLVAIAHAVGIGTVGNVHLFVQAAGVIFSNRVGRKILGPDFAQGLWLVVQVFFERREAT